MTVRLSLSTRVGGTTLVQHQEDDSSLNPKKELAQDGRNMKYVKACTSLHFAHKNASKLSNFEDLLYLEELWINNNRLHEITGLDVNTRIKYLYAHNNLISTLEGSIQHMLFMDTLDVSENRLRNLSSVLQSLSHFKHLKNLNLSGNPCCEEPGYRSLVLAHLPELKILDMHQVTPAEVRRAKERVQGPDASSTVGFGTRAPPFYGEWNAPPKNILLKQLERQVENIKRETIVAKEKEDNRLRETNPHPSITAKILPPAPPGWPEAATKKFESDWRSGAMAERQRKLARREKRAKEREEREKLALEAAAAAGDTGGQSDNVVDHHHEDSKEEESLVGGLRFHHDEEGSSSDDEEENHGGQERRAGGDLSCVPQTTTSRTWSSSMNGTLTLGQETTKKNKNEYKPKDVYKFYATARDTEGMLSKVDVTKKLRFRSTGISLDRNMYETYLRRKAEAAPVKIIEKSIKL